MSRPLLSFNNERDVAISGSLEEDALAASNLAAALAYCRA
jgi:hypothetical protein